MSDFLYVDHEGLWNLGTPDWISFDKAQQSFVSNIRGVTELYAPEIDWYLKVSHASKDEKLTMLHHLYEARAIKFDHDTRQNFQENISPTLLIVGESPLASEFTQLADQAGFDTAIITHKKIKHVYGKFGAFSVVLDDDSVGEFAQIVLFTEDKNLAKRMGVEQVCDYSDAHALLATLQGRLGDYSYKTVINYDSSLCQYHHRRELTCGACASVCPTFGISRDDTKMELRFSEIDCIACGGCVAVCPSGAIDYAPYPKEAFYEIARLFSDMTMLVLEESSLKELEEISLPSGIAPLIVDKNGFLSELHLLTLLQESGSSLILYSPVVSRPISENLSMLNEVYERAYHTQGIYLARDIPELLVAFDRAKPIASSRYRYTITQKESRRKSFSERLRYIVKDQELGRIPGGEFTQYGGIRVDPLKCTLCLSCVGACNVNSLMANSNAFTLDSNSSLCTTCGYCISSCPEDAMSLDLTGIELTPAWFETKVLAKDEMFKCVECGKPFATKKSVEKIKSMLVSLFMGDEMKLRSLECCPDCKVKVMMGLSDQTSEVMEVCGG